MYLVNVTLCTCYLIYDLLPPYLQRSYLPATRLKEYDEDKFSQLRSHFLLNYKHLPHSTNTSVIHILCFLLIFIRSIFTYWSSFLFWSLSKLCNLWIRVFLSFDKQFFFLVGWFTGSCWTVRAGTDRTTTSGRIWLIAHRNGLFQNERSMKTSVHFSQLVVRLRTLKSNGKSFGAISTY